jgi:hypothetical protein
MSADDRWPAGVDPADYEEIESMRIDIAWRPVELPAAIEVVVDPNIPAGSGLVPRVVAPGK